MRSDKFVTKDEELARTVEDVEAVEKCRSKQRFVRTDLLYEPLPRRRFRISQLTWSTAIDNDHHRILDLLAFQRPGKED